MYTIFKQHRVSQFWNLAVLVLAFLFYLTTAAFTPYPGLSAEYLTALCYPEHGAALFTSALDTLFYRTLVMLIPPTALGTATALVQSFLGALLTATLFRAAVVAVRHATIDLTGIREDELHRTLFTVTHVAFITGLGTALLTLTALPIWTVATRPYPQTLLALATLLTVTFALESRWKTAQNLLFDRPPSPLHHLLFAVTFAGISLIATLQLTLLPVMGFALLIAGTVFIHREAEGRLSLLVAAIAGLLTGLLLSVFITAQSAALTNPTQAVLPDAFTLWAQAFAQKAATLVPYFTSLEGLAPLLLFLVGAALYFGCFPYAYLHRGTPFIGHLAGAALLAAILFRIPAELWVGFEAPDALSIAGCALALLCIALLLGSWAHAFLNTKHLWSRTKTRTVAVLSICTLTGSLAIFQGVRNAACASANPMHSAMESVAPVLDALVPPGTRMWLTSTPDTLGIIARHTLAGTPVQPHPETFLIHSESALFRHGCLGEFAQSDPLIHHLGTVGSEPLRQYLLANAAQWGIITDLPAQPAATEMARAATLLKATDFGTSHAGKRCIQLLNELAARHHARCAIITEPETAASHLRLARTLNPDNPGIALSLAALEAQGISITEAERDAARDVLEASPALRAPTAQQALTFEYRYGPVTTKGFCSAGRLRRLQLGNAPEVLDELCHLYRTAPETLSTVERWIAILHLPEAEAAERVAQSDPEAGDMELFFCLYPSSPVAEQLYRQHSAALAERDALTVLFRNKHSHLRERTADKMNAFFLRDGVYAYALYYLNALLSENDLTTAIAFAGSFNVQERLKATPALAEDLRYRVLEKMNALQPKRAQDVCEAWLRSDPRQYRLWTFLLRADLPPDAREHAAGNCLMHYPLHPLAAEIHARKLEREVGAELANRYRDSVKRATAAASNIKKDTHAHR